MIYHSNNQNPNNGGALSFTPVSFEFANRIAEASKDISFIDRAKSRLVELLTPFGSLEEIAYPERKVEVVDESRRRFVKGAVMSLPFWVPAVRAVAGELEKFGAQDENKDDDQIYYAGYGPMGKNQGVVAIGNKLHEFNRRTEKIGQVILEANEPIYYAGYGPMGENQGVVAIGNKLHEFNRRTEKIWQILYPKQN